MAATDPPPPTPPRQGLGGLIGRMMGVAESLASGEVEEAASTLRAQAEAFHTLRVAEVMTPRARIVAIEVSSGMDELAARFIESEHSRLPIFRETLDQPVGVVHVKDLFRLMVSGETRLEGDEPLLPRIAREPLYVVASMRAADLLLRMQTERVHMALVIDEFGGVDGLCTLEDLIESLVGEIDDEYDETAASAVVALEDGSWDVDASADLETLEAVLGEALSIDGVDDDVESVGGLVTALGGQVPQAGQVLEHPAGFAFEVLDADPRRVKQVRVRRVALVA